MKINDLFINKINFPNKGKLNFIIINIFISIIGFLRSMVYMKYLNFKELGIITIIQTLIGFVGIFQLGLLNGGYRIYSIHNENQDTNNFIYTYFLLLLSLSSSSLVVLYFFNVNFGVKYILAAIGIIFGIITLCNNWIQNILIALVKFKQLNKVNILSSLFSLLFIYSVSFWGLNGAVLTIISKPVFFLLFCLISYKYTRPNKLYFNFKQAKWILTFGFIPFLTGIFNQFNIQIERWSIVYFLDTEFLGKFYLPVLYSSLFMLVPVAVNNIFFPPAMKTFVNEDFKKFKQILKKYYIFVFLYILISLLITILFISPVIAFLFPIHLIGIKYVYAIFPGLAVLLLIRPIGLLYNASVKLKPLLWGYLTSVPIMISLIYLLSITNNFTLFNVAIVKSLVSIYIGIFLYVSYFFMKKKIWVVNKKLENKSY